MKEEIGKPVSRAALGKLEGPFMQFWLQKVKLCLIAYDYKVAASVLQLL